MVSGLLSLYFSLTLSTKGLARSVCGSSKRLAMSTLAWHAWEERNQEKPTSRCSPSRALYVCDLIPACSRVSTPIVSGIYHTRWPVRAGLSALVPLLNCPAATWLPALLPACCMPSASFFFSFLSLLFFSASVACVSVAILPLCSRPPLARRSDRLRSYSILLGPTVCWSITGGPPCSCPAG